MGREAKKYLTMNGKSNMSDEQFADMVDARRKYHSARHHKNPSKKDDEPVSRAIERHEKLSELDTSTTSMESASSDLAATTAQLAGESPPSHKSSKTSASTLARMTGNLSPRRYNQACQCHVTEECSKCAPSSSSKSQSSSAKQRTSSEKAPLLPEEDAGSSSNSCGCCCSVM
eukprot:m.81968 g.81968  ORF g.81968 m.81968 type:complete len:173 (+) comp14709_c0_seq4:406-924(+)